MKQFLDKEPIQAMLTQLSQRISAAVQLDENALAAISTCDDEVCQKVLAVCTPAMEQQYV